MTLNFVLDFFCGRVRRRTLLALIPTILVAYFGTLALAIWAVPAPFDWRYKSISKLLYLRTDPELPALHLFVSIGILGIDWFHRGTFVSNERRSVPARVGARIFEQIGCISQRPSNGVTPLHGHGRLSIRALFPIRQMGALISGLARFRV